MLDDNDVDQARKTYYVSVQSGQILEDPRAAAYELVIQANEEELGRLEELFQELVSMDEAQAFHFSRTPYETDNDGDLNAGYDGLVMRIYRLLHEYGTESTKQHIETMQLFG